MEKDVVRESDVCRKAVRLMIQKLPEYHIETLEDKELHEWNFVIDGMKCDVILRGMWWRRDAEHDPLGISTKFFKGMDAQINIGVYYGNTQSMNIYFHKKGFPLIEKSSWVKEVEKEK